MLISYYKNKNYVGNISKLIERKISFQNLINRFIQISDYDYLECFEIRYPRNNKKKIKVIIMNQNNIYNEGKIDNKKIDIFIMSVLKCNY